MSVSSPTRPVTPPRARGWRSEVLWTVILFAILVGTLLRVQARERPAQPYDPDSGAPQGLLALRLWLEEEGYRVTTTGQSRFRLDDDTDLLFVHPGLRPFSPAHADQVMQWVQAGGTLVLVGSHTYDRNLSAAFGLRAEITATQRLRDARQVLPLLPEAPATITNTISPEALSFEPGSAAVPVLRAGTHPTLAIAPLEAGTVWYLSQEYDLTNQSLKNTGQSVLLPALLRTVPAGGRIAFDTYHLVDATMGLEYASVQDWLYQTPAGWALLFAGFVVFGAIVWQGRRLGPALPPVAENRRREAAEFVTAMANLQRRAHRRAQVAAHHHQRLKTALGTRYQVTPDLADAEFVRAVAASERAPGPDRLETLRQVLAGLRGDASESALVHWVARSDELLDQLSKET